MYVCVLCVPPFVGSEAGTGERTITAQVIYQRKKGEKESNGWVERGAVVRGRERENANSNTRCRNGVE